MATRGHESTSSPVGIAHLTVVPENFDPGWVYREGEPQEDVKGADEPQANRARVVGGRDG